MNIINIKGMNKNVIDKLLQSITDSLSANGIVDVNKKNGLVYAAYIAKSNDIEDANELKKHFESNLSKDRKDFIKCSCENDYSIVIDLAKNYDEDKLAAYIYHCDKVGGTYANIFGTPEYIAKLALKVLGVNKKESLADFGSGIGDFIIQAADEAKYKSVYGIEFDKEAYEMSCIRAELFTERVEVKYGDIFSLDENDKFDKIFSNYPFGLRLNSLQQSGIDFIDKLHHRIPGIKRATSSDWLFNTAIVDHLNDGGKAVAIATNGSTWNSLDQSIREYFVENGLIEAVIALPAKLFEITSIPTTLLVFSRGNKSIRVIDAKDICEQGRRHNTLSESDIEIIVSLLNKDSERSKLVSIEEVKKVDYVLNPGRFLENDIEIENGVEFGSIMKRITRGAQIKANDLDEMVSDSPTDIQYLMLANIQNGMIADNLPYLKELDYKLNKYCIGNRNLLLSKNGAPFKVAVADIEDGQKVLANGNLFIIEIDESKADPYYIKAFFDSKLGVNALNSIVVGATIPNISAEALKKLIIPLPSKEKQMEIANLYQEKQDEIRNLQLQIQKAQDELKNIFEEVE